VSLEKTGSKRKALGKTGDVTSLGLERSTVKTDGGFLVGLRPRMPNRSHVGTKSNERDYKEILDRANFRENGSPDGLGGHGGKETSKKCQDEKNADNYAAELRLVEVPEVRKPGRAGEGGGGGGGRGHEKKGRRMSGGSTELLRVGAISRV